MGSSTRVAGASGSSAQVSPKVEMWDWAMAFPNSARKGWVHGVGSGELGMARVNIRGVTFTFRGVHRQGVGLPASSGVSVPIAPQIAEPWPRGRVP